MDTLPMRQSINRYEESIISEVSMKSNAERIVHALIDGAIIVIVLLCFLMLLGWMSERDLEDRVETHKAESRRVTSMLADCLNGKTLFDYNTNTALFCSKALEVKL